MSRKILMSLCAGLLVMACGKGEPATKTDTSTTDTSASRYTLTVPTAADATDVEIHILGTAALIDQTDTNHPMAAILPEVPAMAPATDLHVAYVAWHEENEEQDPSGNLIPITQTVVPQQDTIDKTYWHVHPLVNEELVIDNDLSKNPAMPAAASGPCNPDFKHDGAGTFGCVAPVTEFGGLSTAATYDSTYVDKVTKNKKVMGRLEIGNGILVPYVTDECKWDVTPAGAATATHRYLASDIVYRFKIDGAPGTSTLKLQLRPLDGSAPPAKFVNLQSRDGHVIELRFGNAINVFPDKGHGDIPADTEDTHFATYYNLIPTAAARPKLVRTKDCGGGPFDKIVYCGPGWVYGVGPKKP
jgi:hypothetical protein